MSETHDPVYPVPEFIKGAKGAGWKITDSRSTGGAKMRPGILHVPLDMACPLCGKAHSLAVRNHEIAHAEITLDKHSRMPVLPPGLKLEYFQAVEDRRIWDHVRRSYKRTYGSEFVKTEGEHGGLEHVQDIDGELQFLNPPALCSYDRVKWEAVYKGLDDKGRVLFAVAAGQSDENMVTDIVRKCTPEEAVLDAEAILNVMHEAHRMLISENRRWGPGGYSPDELIPDSRTPPIYNTYKVAAWLQKLLEPPESDKDKEPEATEGSDPSDDELAETREAEGEGAEVREARPDEIEDLREKNKHDMRKREETYSADSWCEVQFDTPTLGRHLPGRLIARYESSDEGTFIRRPDRLLVDQKIFGRKHRVQGGGVLIDDSGSMGLGLEEILEILYACPGATIGVYSATGSVGTLRIVAKDGRVIDDERQAHTPGSGNGIDGPALEWLGSLPFSRKVWISDGQVTGRGDMYSTPLKIQRDILLKKHSITWVNPAVVGRDRMAAAAVAALSGKHVLAGKGY